MSYIAKIKLAFSSLSNKLLCVKNCSAVLKIRYAHVKNKERKILIMAIYHFNCKIISRGKGQSAIASAAYRSGDKLYSERYGESNFYRREVSPETFILKPKHAPEWTLDREKLWNEVEAIEKSSRAQLAREINVALPIELSNEEQITLTKDYVQTNFVDEGMVADVSIHRDNKSNPHFHVMLTTRPFEKDGEWGKKSNTIFVKDEEGNQVYTKNGSRKNRKVHINDWDNSEKIKEWRKNWASLTNQYLEKNGFSQRISEKSYAELGEKRVPTIHEGYVARQMEKRGQASERAEVNRQIKKENYTREETRKEMVAEKTTNTIIPLLSPTEKQDLKRLAKDLKIYINYDNLVDKERMVNNWKNAEKVNQLIKPGSFDETIFDKINETQDNVQRGKDILTKESIRIFERHYPTFKNAKFSDYAKISIGQETLLKDKVLDEKELKDILAHAQDNELKDMMRTITKKPYLKDIKTYQKDFYFASKKIDQFLDENQVDKETVHTLAADKKETFKQLDRTQKLRFNTLKIAEKYYEQTILSNYPTANIKDLNAVQKEAVSQLLSYYGSTLSYTKITALAQKEVVSKYSTVEQRMGLQLLDKIEKGKLTDEDLKSIADDYHKKELFETVSNPETRGLFLKEVEENGISLPSNWTNYSKPSLFGTLANSLKVYDNLIKSSEDNVRREMQQKSKRKKKSISSRSTKSSNKNPSNGPKI